MQNEDFEQAAAHVHRFLTMDENLLKHTAMDVSEGKNMDASFHKLHEAEQKLKQVVIAKFDEAVKDEDLASVERFFKIFPLLNMHEEGLGRFTTYLCSKLRETCQKNLTEAKLTRDKDKRASVIYADSLTLLFEAIARIVEIHQPLIETYYGPGRMLSVMEYIQKECDHQAKMIVDEFRKHRDFIRKIHIVTQYMNQKSETKIDPKELDLVLSELTLLNARTELYSRFVKKRVTNDVDVSITDESEKSEKLSNLDRLLKDGDTFRVMQVVLGQYILLEQYFMAESVQKAVEMDTLIEASSQESFVLSSMTDDVFFIVKKCIKRSLSSQSVDGVCAVINNACGILESDFADLLLSQLRQGFPSGYLDLAQAYSVLQSSFQHGKLQGSDIEKSRAHFVAYLNNTDTSMEYVTSLKSSLESSMNDSFGQHLTPYEKDKITSCLQGLASVNIRLKSVFEFGLSQLKSSAVKPRVKPWLDAFFHARTSYELDEDQFTDDSVPMQTFISDLDSILKSFKGCLSPSAYEAFINLVTTEIALQMEKSVLKNKFNRIGGLQLDKELRILVGYLTNATTWSVRDKFSRLTQMTILLTLEKVSEVADYWGKGPVTWRLTAQEVRQVLSLRSDFRSEDVKRLKL
ncbi:conserved oligomeric Golgi complex subunit 4 isoform X2 [Folsomia candida]|nr:conserved oligomeric Golgi complex subunit 4 isoform X2 [Folsomia candida]